jgi:hypothetical protein
MTGAEGVNGCTAGDAIGCSSLGGSWSSGNATCRADGKSWDVTPCTLATPGRAETVKPAERNPGRFSGARCNDGSPFSMLVRLAPTPSPVWSIYLEGGVYCDDYSFVCAARGQYLTTTSSAPDGQLDDFDGTGILGTNPDSNPDFHDANQVFAHYCSSDFWSGASTERRPSSGNPSGWYFSGHAIVDALVGILAERYGLEDSNPDLHVLFGGGSAGAWGAHLNQQRVATALPNAAASGRLALLVDAGWMTDWNDTSHALGDAKTADADVWKRARAFWGATFDPDCERAAEAAGRDPSVCFVAPNWYPHVSQRGPVLVQQCSFDSSFTDLHHLAATDDAAATWRSQVTGSFDGVTWLFSGSTPSYHQLAPADGPLGTEPPGDTFMEVLHAFWTGGTPRRVVY